MDPQNLQTASLYVNNLLLSRGLLRDGTPLEFAKPSKAEGGANATMAQIINLVHDLVLRRDRETDTLSTLSQNLQILRTTTAQQTQNITRLETRSADLERQLASSAGQERSAKASLRSAENRNRTLREDMARLKLSVSQVRSQCANDIRKRDSEIKRLKRHLEGRRGRDGTSGQVGVVVVTPGARKSQPTTSSTYPAGDLSAPTYTLKEETNEFLTHLNQSLFDENDALTSLARDTLGTLRALQGLPSDEDPTSANVTQDPNVTLLIPPSYQALEASTQDVLSHLHTLLTNPSFVPLEDLEARDDEIVRLRAGWEKMESRWREAVAMMDGWRKRMVETGDTINLEDLRKGLVLGEEIVKEESSQGGQISGIELGEESFMENPCESIDAEGDGAELEAERDDTPSPQPKAPAASARPDIELGVGLFPAPNILQPASGNVRRELSPHKSSPRHAIPSPATKAIDLLPTSDELAADFSLSSPSRPKKRPSPSDAEFPLSVQQKLELARREAEKARLRGDGARKTGLPRAKVRAGRRRSTLSPEELEGLMGLGG